MVFFTDLLKRRDQGDDMTLPLNKLDDEGKEPNWGKGSLGAFSSGGLFGSDNGTPSFKSEAPFGSTTSDLGGLSTVKKPEETKWFYRDPSGQVQGPFEAQEMQDWYKAGFFTPTLMLCREDETVFETLMVLTQKVGNDDQPFLTPRPRSTADLFSTPDNLFRNDLQSRYMPFGSPAPTTPGGSIMDSFLGGNTPTTPLYQSPYNYGGSLLRDNRWGNDNNNQPQQSPSWLNHNNPASQLGFMPPQQHHHQQQQQQQQPQQPQQQQQPQHNPVFGSNISSPGLFDYQRVVNDQFEQHQQYAHILQQNQQQRSMQFQQQFNQMQQPPQQQQSSPLDAFKNTQLENVTNISSNHASPVLRPNILTGGWNSSAPGTPIGEVPSSPWGSIVSAAIPTKVSEELQAKAPGAQSPRAPSSPKKPIEKPVKTKTIVESFADIQIAEEKKAEEKKIARATEEKRAMIAAAEEKKIAAAAVAASTATSTASAQVPEETLVKVSTPAPVVTKPIISLREIQQEELRIANENKQKQAKVSTTVPSWAASNSTPLHTTTTTWSQPAHKPLSLREIQEMEAKNAELIKKETSAAEYLTQQERLANTTPSNLSWGVVVPNSKSIATPTSSTASINSAAWTAPSGPKKTLREIQQEEELATKKKNAKAIKSSTTAAAIAAANAPSSRAYSVPSAPSAGGVWTTVTSARVSKPVTPVATPAPGPSPAPVRWEPVKPVVTAPRTRGPSEEFRRWCRKALRDLNSGVNQDEIVDMLLSFPVDSSAVEIIEDVIYANSLRIDGKRFSQEFMKRRKADLVGRLDIVTAGLEEEDEDDFKVVQKKGKKKNFA